MIAYHDDKKVKDKYVKRFRAHMKADEVVQGVSWESNGTTRGCAVGCTLNKYSHKAFETELGIPEDVARLLDTLFEGLPAKDAPKFALDFLLAVKPGSDLTRIRFKFCAFLMREALVRVEGLTLAAELKKQVLDAVRGSLKLNEEEVPLESAAWSAAWSAARSAAWSAAYQTYAKEFLRLVKEAG